MLDKIKTQLVSKYYKKKELVIEKVESNDGKINKIQLNGKQYNSFFISHDELVNG